MHLYPAIDLRGGKCVRLVQGDYQQETVYGDDPVFMAKQWVDQGADRLHVVDLDGAKSGKPVNVDVIKKIVTEAGVPCQLGGGIRTEADLDLVFSLGVHWAVLGTKAMKEPDWCQEMARKRPGQIVLGLDARDGYVATEGWLETTQLKATELALKVAIPELAAIVYTDIARDGMLVGPNYAGLAEIRNAVETPVISSGGISELEQLRKLAQGQTFGCIIGKALYERKFHLKEAIRALAES